MAENVRSAQEAELVKVKSFVAALEEQDILLVEGIRTKVRFETSLAQMMVIKGIFEDILAYQANLVRPLHVHADPNGLRSQIRDARLKVITRSDELASALRVENPAHAALEKLLRPADAVDKRRVFVVYGRNLEARDAMFAFLRALDLDPFEWGEAVKMTEKSTPHPEEVLRAAFSSAQAGIILFTGDDLARVGRRFLTTNDSADERFLTPQVRPNVLFEAGMSWGNFYDRTVIVELGRTRELSDIKGLHTIRISNTVASRQSLADRLRDAKCLVKTEGRADWHSAGNFEAASNPPDLVVGQKQAGLRVVRRQANPEVGATYTPKVWVDIRNDSGQCLEIRHLGWSPSPLGIQINFGPTSLQLKIDRFWCPNDGTDRIHMPSGEAIRLWVHPTPQHDMKDLQQRCLSEDRIGI